MRPTLALLLTALLSCSEDAVTRDASTDVVNALDVSLMLDALDASDAPDVADAAPDTAPVTDAPDVSALIDADDGSDAPDVLDPPDSTSIIDVGAPSDAPRDGGDATASCLPTARGDLLAFVAAAPYASRSGSARMPVAAHDAAPWRAARHAAMAWAADDCEGFRAAATAMGYAATELTDTATARRHWALVDASGRYGGVFVFRAPSERAGSRALVIDAPHWGYDFTDDRAARAYRQLDAVAFLQNTAHRCNLDACSGCDAVSNYACGGCVRVSDVVHSVDQLYFAVYDGLEAARDDLHFEYHGAASSANATGCSGTAHLSQASSRDLSAASDEGTWPSRVWRALEARLGAACVCYHQRESGCLLNGAASTAGRRTNAEASPDAGALDVCLDAPTSLSRRFVHMEGYNVPVDDVIGALAAATPPPSH